MRRVKVNAQVTFATWILETVGQVSVFVLWMVVPKHKEMGMTLAVILCYVILPYTFLMNSSYNKNLLIDEGVMNTIRNVLGPFAQTRSKSSQTVNENKHLDQWRRQNSKYGKVAKDKSTEDTEMNLQTSEDKCQSYEGQGSDIYTISRVTEGHPDQKIDPHISVNIPEEQPCASFAVHLFDANQEVNKFVEEDRTQADDARKSLKRRYYLCLAEEILSNMVSNIADENVYMHYLKQLARLTDAKTNKDDVSTKFQITHFETALSPKQGKIKTSHRELKKVGTVASSSKSKNVEMQTQELEVNFLGTFSKRMDKRKAALGNFKQYCLHEDSYEIFSTAIFDLEESLIIGYSDAECEWQKHKI